MFGLGKRPEGYKADDKNVLFLAEDGTILVRSNIQLLPNRGDAICFETYTKSTVEGVVSEIRHIIKEGKNCHEVNIYVRFTK